MGVDLAFCFGHAMGVVGGAVEDEIIGRGLLGGLIVEDSGRRIGTCV